MSKKPQVKLKKPEPVTRAEKKVLARVLKKARAMKAYQAQQAA